MLDHVVCAGCLELGDHERFREEGDYDCAWEVEGARGVHGSEACIASAGAVDVGITFGGRCHFGKAALDEVAYASVDVTGQFTSLSRGRRRDLE
jgi:hypothetical protein